MNEEDEERDLYLEELLTDVIAPYIGVLPDDEIRSMRRALRATVADDPELFRLHQAARPRVAPASTGEAVRDDGVLDEDGAVAAITPRRKEGAA